MKKFNIVLLLGFLLIVVSCEKDNLESVPSRDQVFSSYEDLINSGIDLQSLATKPHVTSYDLINTRSVAVVFFTDPADFDCPDLPLEDFAEGTGYLAAFPHPLDQFSDNAVFSPGDILPGVSMSASSSHSGNELFFIPAGFFGNPSNTITTNFFADSFLINFTSEGITAVSMDIFNFVVGSTPIFVEVFGISGSLGMTSVPSTSDGAYLGIMSSESITSITVGSPKGEAIANLAFGSCTMIIDGCDTGIPDYTFDDGDTMLGLIMECAAEVENHGEFVSCVSHLTNEWKKDGLITGDQKETIMDCVSAADLP